MVPAESSSTNLRALFSVLRGLLEPYIGRMRVFEDNDHSLYLNAPVVMRNGMPMFFASTALLPHYVSFHFQPLVRHPELLDAAGSLLDHLDGTSSFAFERIAPDEVEKLHRIVIAGLERFEADIALGL